MPREISDKIQATEKARSIEHLLCYKQFCKHADKVDMRPGSPSQMAVLLLLYCCVAMPSRSAVRSSHKEG